MAQTNVRTLITFGRNAITEPCISSLPMSTLLSAARIAIKLTVNLLLCHVVLRQQLQQRVVGLISETNVYKQVSMAATLQPSAREYNWATLFLGNINTGTWPSRLGESRMR
jgi:hypothetical protein